MGAGRVKWKRKKEIDREFGLIWGWYMGYKVWEEGLG